MPVSPEELFPATRRALLHRIATAQSEGRSPSLVGAVVRDRAVVWTLGRGTVEEAPPTGDTQYRIGSLTKSLVAVLVMRLRDEGALTLCDTLGAHLPKTRGTRVGRLSVAQLLSHTSGLYAETPPPWWERTPGSLRPGLADVLRGGLDGPAAHPPGRVFHYSNPGYALLGALVEQVRGEPWDEVLRREVLEPLGMADTTPLPRAPHARGWAVHPWADVLLPEPAEDTGRMAPAGQIWSTAADLGRFAAFLAEGGEGVLSADSVAEMRTPAAAPREEEWDSGYGLGLQLIRVNGRLLAGHTGSMPGFLAALWVSAEEGTAGIALANCTSGPAIGTLAADLVSEVADREPRIPRAWAPRSEDDPALVALTGPWYWGTRAFVLRLRAGRALELRALEEGRGAAFRAEADGTWTGLDGYYAGETLSAVRRADGSVSHLDIGSFVFTREPYDAGAAVPGGVDPGGWRGTPSR